MKLKVILFAFVFCAALLAAQEAEDGAAPSGDSLAQEAEEAVAPSGEGGAAFPLEDAAPAQGTASEDASGNSDAPREERTVPKVALVLSGGGAKGFAEVPLLEALEAHGIYPDMVLGTSMGSLIGGLYAAGYSPREIRETLLELDFMSILNESPARDEKVLRDPFDNKVDALSLTFSLARGKAGSAPGLLGDQKIILELSNHLSRVMRITDFDELPIPFRAIGTDVSIGEQIVFDSGSLVSAIRASISIPGAFTPAKTEDGRFAMDGGLRNNMPVLLARELGADIVIAMDVASVVRTDPTELSDFFTVAMCIFDLIISPNAVQQYDAADIVLRPDLSAFSTFSFGTPEAIMDAGQLCVEQNEEALERIAQYLEDAGVERKYLPPDRVSAYSQMSEPVINGIEVTDISFCDPVPLPHPNQFGSFVGMTLDEKTKQDLSRRLNRLRDRYHLSSLTYYIKEENGRGIMEVRANHYDMRMNRLYFSAAPSLSVSNFTYQNILGAYADIALGAYFYNPFDIMLDFSYADKAELAAEFVPRLISKNDMDFGIDVKAGVKYGSLEPHSHPLYTDRSADEDLGVEAFLGVRAKISDFFMTRLGFSHSTDWVKSSDKWHNTTLLEGDLLYTTLHNDFSALYGSSIKLHAAFGADFTDLENNFPLYSVHLGLEKRFELITGWTSLGIEGEAGINRLPSSLNTGYYDVGGIGGVCGYPVGTLRRDFAFAGISLRQKVSVIFGMPLYLILVGRGAVYSPDVAFVEPYAESRAVPFSGAVFEAGGGLYAALATPFGSVILGGSVGVNMNENMNRKVSWCVSLGFR